MRTRELRRFGLHYLEMIAAMLVGMMVLYPVWLLATIAVDDGSVLRSVEVETLVMATTMAAPMAGWMRFRGHARGPTLEMSAAMYAGFVVALPFHWAGALGEHGVMTVGHVLMFAFMLGAMLLRWTEYAGGHSHHGEDDPAPTMAGS